MDKGGALGSFSIRLNWPPLARTIIAQYGSQKITQIFIRRNPLKEDKIINVITFGQWNKAKKAAGYDSMYHLYMQIALEDGVNLILEKNEVINLAMGQTPSQSSISVPIIAPITLNELLTNARQAVGNDKLFFSYDPFDNNCQVFINNILNANTNALQVTPQTTAFIMQKTDVLKRALPSAVQSAARGITSFAGKLHHLFRGGSLFSGVKSMSTDPSVLIDFKSGLVYDSNAVQGNSNVVYYYSGEFNPFSWYNGSNIESVPLFSDKGTLRTVGQDGPLIFQCNPKWVLVAGGEPSEGPETGYPCYRVKVEFESQLRHLAQSTLRAANITTFPVMLFAGVQTLLDDKRITLTNYQNEAYSPAFFVVQDSNTQAKYLANWSQEQNIISLGGKWEWDGLEQQAKDIVNSTSDELRQDGLKRKADHEDDQYNWQKDMHNWTQDTHGWTKDMHDWQDEDRQERLAQERIQQEEGQNESGAGQAWDAFKGIASFGLGSLFGGSLAITNRQHRQLMQHLHGGGFFHDFIRAGGADSDIRSNARKRQQITQRMQGGGMWDSIKDWFSNTFTKKPNENQKLAIDSMFGWSGKQQEDRDAGLVREKKRKHELEQWNKGRKLRQEEDRSNGISFNPSKYL